jgi:hypothetical protein
LCVLRITCGIYEYVRVLASVFVFRGVDVWSLYGVFCTYGFWCVYSVCLVMVFGHMVTISLTVI